MKLKTPSEKKILKKTVSTRKKSKPTEKKSANDSKARDEIKNLKAALHDREENLQTILNNIEDGYYESNLAGSITFFNNSLCRIAGRTKKEIVGLNYRQYVSEKTAKEMYDVYNKVYTTGRGIKNFVYELYTKKGESKFIETSITLRKDHKENKIGFQGIVRDITDRKIAEDAMQKRDERCRTILEDIEDEYFELDLTGNFTFVNDSLARYLGYPKAKLI